MNVLMNVMISQLIENKVRMSVTCINKVNILMKFISFFINLKKILKKMSHNLCNDDYHNSYIVIKTEHF